MDAEGAMKRCDGSNRSRWLRWTVLLTAALPQWVGATAQCPPGTGEKGPVFWAVGFGVLGLFFVLGLAVVFGAVRATRGLKWTRRLPLLLAALVAMLCLWTLGLWLFGSYFVMVC
ncbi:hypothetical protein LA76x_4029 [Lysobacter antibioticus]|uniref:Transmembrane protein n=2 Tax=Lysobacter antibioticus TaxID=84531 RepID=A0A0S2FF57_LYSAN|nr:hypothetical protein LA76x_4029 [Lysobacter antibioticus]